MVSRDVTQSGLRRMLLGGASVLGIATAHPAAAQTALSPAWLSARIGAIGATPRPGSATASGGAVPSGPAAASQSAQQVQASLANFKAAATAIATASTAQMQARASALAALPNLPAVPDGVGAGALNPAATGWVNATAPVQQAAANGRIQVTVQQTAKTAVAQWTTFNVSRNTDLVFNQSAGGSASASWVILNEVNDPAARPSQILGSISAPGQVYVVNRNGIIFGGNSQVNAGALLAATADFTGGVTGFLNQGLYSAATTTGALAAAFGGTAGTQAAAGSSVTVTAGASITTAAPASATSGGGFVILMADQVSNAGSITTPSGQAALAAGQSFFLTPGYSATGGGDALSTTLGTQIATTYAAGSTGRVSNTGVLTATQGDVTLAGHTVLQSGAVLTTSTTAQRGTIHLLTNLADPTASVTLAPGSLTQVAPDTSSTATALDSQRASLISQSAINNTQRLTTTPLLNNTANMSDQLDQGRVEISAGGLINVQGGALVMAQGGQVAAAAGTGTAAAGATNRIYIGAGATIDVSGLQTVTLPASADTVSVSIQSNELRDSAGSRLNGGLKSTTVTVNQNDLVLVPASTAYPSDRYYTGGGLLEVSGQLANIGHTISEWSTIGGSITLSGGQVVAQQGALLNLQGGSVAYAAGTVATSWVQASSGAIYNINSAPGALVYTGVYGGTVESHVSWNVTNTFYSPLIGAQTVQQAAYTVGRDAGRLTISAPTVVMDATVNAGVVAGVQQNAARSSGVTDPFLQPQTAAPLAGSIALGDYNAVGLVAVYATQVTIGGAAKGNSAALAADTALPDALANTADLAGTLVSGLGGVSVATAAPVTVTGPVNLGFGGTLSVTAPITAFDASVTAPGGTIKATNSLVLTGSSNAISTLVPAQGAPGITVAPGVALKTTGVWTNAFLDPLNVSGAGFTNGGSITLDSSGALVLAQGSIIDTSAGGSVGLTGKISLGKGGSVTLAGDDPALNTIATIAAQDSPVSIGATITGYGGSGAGALSVTAPSIAIARRASAKDGVTLAPGFFTHGFTDYKINGFRGLTLAGGTKLQPVAPALFATADARYVTTGSDPSAALTTTVQIPDGLRLVLKSGKVVYATRAASIQPVYTFNPVTSTVTQRQGASISLLSDQNGTGGGSVLLGDRSLIQVDPLQSVSVSAWGSITALGSITAPSGAVTLTNERFQDGVYLPSQYAQGLSIWIGPKADINVAAVAATALDGFGQPYGIVPAGGSISIGGVGGLAGDGTTRTTDAQIIIRPGAVLDAAGTSAQVNPLAGTPGVTAATASTNIVTAASNGGSIALSSYSGIFPDGTLLAPGGGPGAAGGSLSLTLETPVYYFSTISNIPQVSNALRRTSDIIVTATQQTLLRANLTPGAPTPRGDFAKATISAAQVENGGFGSLSLSSRGLISFAGTVGLALGQSITLANGIITDTKRGSAVTLSAPYVKLSGDSTVTVVNAVNTSALITQIWAPPLVTGNNTLTVNAGLIDIQNDVRFGTNTSITLQSAPPRAVAATGFAAVTLDSTGDVRFLDANNSQTGSSTLYSGGDVSVQAAQLYPVTQAHGVIVAGYDFHPSAARATANPLRPNGTLTITQTPGTDPLPPDSVDGSLVLAAGTVIQDGTVRAPLGSISVGVNTTPTALVDLSGTQSTYTTRVELGPDSITSVSAAGQTIPFGGTSDTVSYTYNGTAVTPFAPTLTLGGESITVAPGATVDLRGGGTLAGGAGELLTTSASGVQSLTSQGFISGRGGSTDTLVTPLLTLGSNATLATNPVYAVMTGPQPAAAPKTPLDTASNYYGSVPAVGQTITITAAAGGLPAGTYTLLPSYYALLPGGYRVEIASTAKAPTAAISRGNGTTEVAATQGIAGTSVESALPVAVLVTPGAQVRNLSQYNEETYSTFLTGQAALFDQHRPVLPQDAGTLVLSYPNTNTVLPRLTFDGAALVAPAADGAGATLEVTGSGTAFQIIAPGTRDPTRAVGLSSGALDAIGASSVIIGGTLSYDTGLTGNKPSIQLTGQAQSVQIDTGATLSAPEVILLADHAGNTKGAITLRPGASIDTAGTGAPTFDSATTGVAFDAQRYTAVIVSNGQVVLAPIDTQLSQKSGPITIGSGASLLSAGSIVLTTEGTTTLNPAAVLGAADLALNASSINLGSAAALAAAPLPSGLNLTQEQLSVLLAGGAAPGVAALQSIELTANKALNLVGSVTLGRTDGGLGSVTIASPAIYGAGSAPDVANITAGTVAWSGVAQQVGATGQYVSAVPNGVLTGGPGSGAGTLNVTAKQIILGKADGSADPNDITLNRTIFGYASVNLTASQSFSANNKSTLSVYQTQSGVGFTGTGGALTITAPVITAASGTQLAVTAGSVLSLAGASGSTATSGLGATLAFTAPRIADSGTISAHGGQVTLTATAGDIALTGATIDVSGLALALGTQTEDVPGGSVILASNTGNVLTDASSAINLSAPAASGSLTVTALSGTASLLGPVSGAGGSVTVKALSVPDFAGLNTILDQGGVSGARIFDVGTGAITVSQPITAHDVEITASGGSLVLDSTINASGTAPGTVRLAAQSALTLTGNAVIDAHATTIATDSTGAPIASANRADVSLTAQTGTLTLAPGAAIDVSVTGSPVTYGTVELFAPRAGNATAAAAPGPLTVNGASSVALYGMSTVSPAGGVVTQAVIDGLAADNTSFINAALANTAFQTSIAGLTGTGVFHLRPGIELDSTGTMTVQGDINLVSYRTANTLGATPVEPGSLTLRAGGTLNVFGSITDGFGYPGFTTVSQGASNPDTNGWLLYAGNETNQTNQILNQAVTVPTAVTLAAGTSFSTSSGSPLNFAVTLKPFQILPDVVIPVAVTLGAPVRAPAGGFVATATISDGNGNVLYAAGSRVPAGKSLPSGTVLAAGSVLPVSVKTASGTVWQAGSPLSVIASATVAALDPVVLAPGNTIPAGTDVKLQAGKALLLRPQVNGVQGQPLVTDPLLVNSLSWSINLVAGATQGSADIRATSAGAGDLVLADTHYAFGAKVNKTTVVLTPTPATAQPGISVIRTGTGDLALLAGGSIVEDSLFGIYTAGSQPSGIGSAFQLPRAADGAGVIAPTVNRFDYNTAPGSLAYQANYPAGGGNVLIAAQGNVTGDVVTQDVTAGSVGYQSDAVSNWLWRQAGPGVSTAWWINFGAYTEATNGTGTAELVGFTGFGALGGGNVTVLAGGNAGNIAADLANTRTTTALDIVAASTGRVTQVNTASDGTVTSATALVTGGGDVTVKIGGALNSANTSLGGDSLGSTEYGVIGSTRGTVSVQAGSIGVVSQSSTVLVNGPLVSTAVNTLGGPLLLLGDAQAAITTRGDLVLGGVIDPTRTAQINVTPVSTGVTAQSAFTLWTGATSAALFSAGGSLSPTQDVTGPLVGQDQQYDYPGTLVAVAAGGNILYGGRSGLVNGSGAVTTIGPSLELAPAPNGTLDLVAYGTVNADALTSRLPLGIDISGANAGINSLPTFARPSTSVTTVAADGTATTATNSTDTLDAAGYTSLFVYEADTPTTNLHANDPNPALIIASTGDIVNLRFGDTWNFTSKDGATILGTWYLAAKPALIEAGRDIIGAGSPSLLPTNSEVTTAEPLKVTSNLILNNNPSDVSLVSAGRDIFYANFDIAGPGNLVVSAGHNFYQANKGSLYSDGLLVDTVAGSRSGGAGIIALAGVGAAGAAAAAFGDTYFNPANLADSAVGLNTAANAGKVADVYSAQLISELSQEYGITTDAAGALAFFNSLPAYKQLPLVLPAYFSELVASAKEYGDSTSVRYKSYLRGKDAIGTLFPGSYSGDITLYGGSGIATSAGGAITTLTPGGQLVLGLANVPPPTPATGQPAAGLITFGNGNVDIYALGNVTLGQSRIFTTDGGGITIWSASGDISAGVGSKTTQVYAPAETLYSSYGTITLSPSNTTSGAGIATLASIPGTAAGDITLVAPLGVIDAGEAGIRASGNVTLAALVVTNAANIQSGGKTSGVAAAASSNTGALDAGNAASAASSNAAASAANGRSTQSQTNIVPSLIVVEVLGFGDGS